MARKAAATPLRGQVWDAKDTRDGRTIALTGVDAERRTVSAKVVDAPPWSPNLVPTFSFVSLRKAFTLRKAGAVKPGAIDFTRAPRGSRTATALQRALRERDHVWGSELVDRMIEVARAILADPIVNVDALVLKMGVRPSRLADVAVGGRALAQIVRPTDTPVTDDMRLSVALGERFGGVVSRDARKIVAALRARERADDQPDHEQLCEQLEGSFGGVIERDAERIVNAYLELAHPRAAAA